MKAQIILVTPLACDPKVQERVKALKGDSTDKAGTLKDWKRVAGHLQEPVSLMQQDTLVNHAIQQRRDNMNLWSIVRVIVRRPHDRTL